MPKVSVNGAVSRAVEDIASDDACTRYGGALSPGVIRPKTFGNPRNNVT